MYLTFTCDWFFYIYFFTVFAVFCGQANFGQRRYWYIVMLGCNDRMVSKSDSQPQDRGFESRQNQLAHQKPSRVGYRWRQWCLASLSRKWVPGYRQRWQLYLDYPWCLEACKQVYTPQGVERVMDVTGLPGVIIYKALWASFGKEKALYKNCILLIFLQGNNFQQLIS